MSRLTWWVPRILFATAAVGLGAAILMTANSRPEPKSSELRTKPLMVEPAQGTKPEQRAAKRLRDRDLQEAVDVYFGAAKKMEHTVAPLSGGTPRKGEASELIDEPEFTWPSMVPNSPNPINFVFP